MGHPLTRSRRMRSGLSCSAAYTFWSKDPSEIFKTNVEGTVNVLKAARDAGVSRTVYTSTVGTIGIPQKRTWHEGTTLDPKCYTATKRIQIRR
ncbi:MAG: hypothetical protein Ct9H300mP11_19810 [Chloroflexota bacterium]|nr:MAG: hypothetical protein Ct9H300mP11_19810 [Chloroflexota bacterium]